jgi:Ca2+-binding RTX toxin-like protein
MGDGNDHVVAGGYNDTIAGGAGNDTLEGGAGNDTYIFNQGDGSDTVIDSSGTNKFVFTDLDNDDFGFFVQNGKLNVSYGDGDNIAITGNVSRYELADGSYLTDADVNYIIQQISAFSQSNGVSFSTANDVRQNEQMAQLIAATWQNS